MRRRRAYDEKIEEILRRRAGGRGGRRAEGGGRAVLDYAGDLYREVHRYASMAMELAREEEFDVIHAHDWMTYPAGVAVAAITGKPLVVHVHSTEFDRSGEHVNQMVYDIERQGMQRADKVIAVSHFTRSIVISRYGIPGDKVEVVYNGVERNGSWSVAPISIRREEKIVLFLGRITMQKGPEYFLQAAKKVLEVMDNVKFVMAGSGDMMHRSVELAAQLGIGHKVLFTGFLRGDDVRRIFKMADLYVMPSVSEPFGIAPLEALGQRRAGHHQQAERRLRGPPARPEGGLLGRQRDGQQDRGGAEVSAAADDAAQPWQLRGAQAAVEGRGPPLP